MAIVIENLTKLYGPQRAIDNLNFRLEPGQIVGFLGPNGAGKSTTMKIVTCYIKPDAGTVRIGNYNIHDHSLEVRRRIGYLPEHNPLYLDMYVHEFLRFAGSIYGLGGKQLRARVAEMVERTGLGAEQHKKIAMLSKGYRQRVGLAQALIHDPEFLILDEPTSGLDPNQVIDIRNLIKDVGRDKTVLFSSHILSEVEAIADRVIIIHKGTIRYDQPLGTARAAAEDHLVLMFEVEKGGLKLEPLLADENIIGIEALSKTKFRVQARDLAVRGVISRETTKQGNTLLSLSQQEQSLEDLFRRITDRTGDPQAVRQLE